MIRWMQDFFSALTWLFARVWFRVRVVGGSKTPASGGFIIAANHASHADPPVVGTFLPRRCYFLARSSLGNTGLAFRFLRSIGTIFVDRDAPARSSMQAAIDALLEGYPLVVFPEGSRTRDGSIGEFRRGVELLVRRAKVPILPVGVRGLYEAFPRGRLLPRPRKVELHVGDLITAEQFKARGGLEYLRGVISDLSQFPLAPTGSAAQPGEREQLKASPTEQVDAGVRENVATTPVRRRSDGPTAARNH